MPTLDDDIAAAIGISSDAIRSVVDYAKRHDLDDRRVVQMLTTVAVAMLAKTVIATRTDVEMMLGIVREMLPAAVVGVKLDNAEAAGVGLS